MKLFQKNIIYIDKEILKEFINNFINSEINEIVVPILPINDYSFIFEKFEFEFIYSDLDQGWYYDFWFDYINHDYDFYLQLSGSLCKGNYKLTKIKDSWKTV